MAAFGWLGPLREPLRRSALSLLHQLLSTDDGRRIASRALWGQPGYPVELDLDVARLLEPVYAELPHSPSPAPTAGHFRPVFVTARFRSGSTLLWNLFRNIDSCTAYYEPLNERRWFDPKARGERVDRTHVGVDDYWREYEGMADLTRLYDERWIDSHLYMSDRFHAPPLREYIAQLIARAPGRPVLQFNRVDFRLTWLRRQFPEATIVHLFRHPRDQWCSSLVDPARVPRNITVREFEQHDHFYLLPWARDLSYDLPFLALEDAEHPYDLFYMLWKLSYVWGGTHADVSMRFESLVAQPALEIDRLMRATGIEQYDLKRLVSVITPQASGKWRRYADDSWYAEREARCNEILVRQLAPLTRRHVGSPERVAISATGRTPASGSPR